MSNKDFQPDYQEALMKNSILNWFIDANFVSLIV